MPAPIADRDRAGIVFVVGAPGNGKTTLMARAVARDFRTGSHVVAYDPTGDLARLAVTHEVEPNQIAVVNSAKQARDKLARGYRWIDFYSEFTTDFLVMQEAWLQIAGELKDGWVYATDEAELLLPNRPTENDHRKAALISIARNKGSRVYLASKVPQRTHIDARQNARYVCCFRTDSENTVKEGCKGFGDPEVFEPSWALEVGQYLYRAPYRKRNSDPLPVYNGTSSPLPFPSLL